MLTSSFGQRPICSVTDICPRRMLWLEIQGSGAASPFIWIILWTCPSPGEPGAQRHPGCSGVAPLSLVVSVSGKNSPGSGGMQGMAAARSWRGWLFRMAHVFHLLGSGYGSLCNHRSLLCTWLLCCDGGGDGETRWGCRNRQSPYRQLK